MSLWLLKIGVCQDIFGTCTTIVMSRGNSTCHWQETLPFNKLLLSKSG